MRAKVYPDVNCLACQLNPVVNQQVGHHESGLPAYQVVSTVVRQWRRSGQSMSEFVRGRGYNEQRLRYWRERVGVQPAAAGQGRQKLLPGVVVSLGGGAPVSVVLPRGVVVEARAVGDIPAAWVAEVVRALESGS